MAPIPDLDIQKAFLAPSISVIRRIEIYEQDGETPWSQELWPYLLVSGSVSIDYDRDERRSLDCELDNSNSAMNPQAGGLWYDKIFKLYYGIRMSDYRRDMRVAIVEEYLAPGQAAELKDHLLQNGISVVHFIPDAIEYSQISEYDVLISISSTTSQKMTFLNACHAQGKSIITFSLTTSAAQLPGLIGSTGGSTVAATVSRDTTPSALAHAINTGWDSWSITDPQPYRRVLTAASGAHMVATHEDDQGESIAILIREPKTVGPRWVHVTQAVFDEYSFEAGYTEFGKFAARAVQWASTYQNLDVWEMQIGEFLADSISYGADYSLVHVVGRDLTKRCMQSQLVVSATFAPTVAVETIIKAIAANAGITKFKLPVTNKTLGKDMTWERGTTRWDIIKEVSLANNYELYFDHEGYLVMREFADPLLTPASLILSTGPGGNLVSLGAKTADSRLFNHIVVVGESSDSTTPPVYAQAINDTPTSPTSIAEIGDRVSITTSSLVTTIAQAQELADSLLAVSQLEEFELQFTSTTLPWVEPGEIIEMNVDGDIYWGPDRYLLTSLTLPLDLSPMSGNGKRVEKVGVAVD